MVGSVHRTQVDEKFAYKHSEMTHFKTTFTAGFIKLFIKTICSSQTKRAFLSQYSRAFRVRLPYVQLDVLRPSSVFCEQLDFYGGATAEYPATSRMLIYSFVERGIQAMVLIRGRISLYSGHIFPEIWHPLCRAKESTTKQTWIWEPHSAIYLTRHWAAE